MRRLRKVEFERLETKLGSFVDLNKRMYDNSFYQARDYQFYGQVFETGYENLLTFIQELLEVTSEEECYLISSTHVYPRRFLYLMREEVAEDERTDLAIGLGDVNQGLSHFLEELHKTSHKDVVLEKDMIYLFTEKGESILIGDHGLNFMLIGIHQTLSLPKSQGIFQEISNYQEEIPMGFKPLDRGLIKKLGQFELD